MIKKKNAKQRNAIFNTGLYLDLSGISADANFDSVNLASFFARHDLMYIATNTMNGIKINPYKN